MNNLFTFEDCQINPNDFILLDTSFLLALCGFDKYKSNELQAIDVKRQQECELLIRKIQAADAMFAISTKTYEELRNVVIRDTFRQSYFKEESDIKALRQHNKSKFQYILGQANNDINKYLHDVQKSNSFYDEFVGIIDHELLEEASDIQIKGDVQGLSDAIQIAIARREGMTHLAVLDRDFAEVADDNLTILTDSHTYNNL